MGSGLTTLQLWQLDQACYPLNRAFGVCTYLVGTAFDGESWRDVDVRTILYDDDFDELFGDRDTLWGLVCLAVGQYLSDASGLPVDFQIQRMTEANEKHGGKPRSPLGMRDIEDYAGGGDATPYRAAILDAGGDDD